MRGLVRRRFDYRDAVAVVTGASSGIGPAVAFELARRGTTVVGMARRADRLDAAIARCREHAPSSTAVVVDVSERRDVETALAGVLERFGRVDVLVNNAGMPMRVHASRLTVEHVERAMEVNFYGSVFTTLGVLPSMLEGRSGHIVNVSSVAGRAASPREAAYTASKHALSGWTDAMAADLAGSGVHFHLVNPGPIDTEIWHKIDEPAAYRGRFYAPETVAAAVCACLDRGSFERWVPRGMRAVDVVRAVAPGLYVRAAGFFDDRNVRRRRP